MAADKPELRTYTRKTRETSPVDTAKKPEESNLLPVPDRLPTSLILLPVGQTTLFPGMMVPLILPEGALVKSAERAMDLTGHVGVVLHRGDDEKETATGPTTSLSGLPPEKGMAGKYAVPLETGVANFYRYGVAAKIVKKVNLPDNQVSILVTGLQRFEVKAVVAHEPHLVAGVEYIYDQLDTGLEMEALIRSALQQFKQLSKDNPLISEEVKIALVNIDGPAKLADFMASVLIREADDYQEFLATTSVKQRMQKLLVLLKRELDVAAVQRKMAEEINQKVASSQKEFYLQEQLKFIQKELGRVTTDRNQIVEKFKERLKGKSLRDDVKKRIDEEFEKLQLLHEQSSEYSVSVNYLDWVTSLPWGLRTPENRSLQNARKVLDADHHGLKDVKERILEFLAVKKLKDNSEGTILCFVGPPGTGKTSLGKSIARALDRKFFRFSVGGMRDEAEIKGHRRTYVGAMPGKLIQGLKRVGTQNPVFLIDEIDKIAMPSMGGDPASALLELLDPEQNPEFLDHYLDIPFDCSEVFFITTANSVDTIPAPLLDRMEVIELNGYTDSEKFAIAKKYLVPKQLKKNALPNGSCRIADRSLKYLIERYARESGVRSLEKQIGKIARKIAYRIAMGQKGRIVLSDPKAIEKFLGPPIYPKEERSVSSVPGVTTGLAWTQFGGDILKIESAVVDGKGEIALTGSLGDVMQESANIAYTFVRTRANELSLKKNYFETHSFHLHVPSGATPKDGPSAGVTMATSLYSLLSGKPVSPRLAMTGELTLSGDVLPVGGIKEKLLAARRMGLQTVLLPRANERDLKQIEKEVREGLQIKFVKTMDEVLKVAFPR